MIYKIKYLFFYLIFFSNTIYSFNIKKKFISIGPAGVYGFYSLGMYSYIKSNFNINKYNFIGASSGSWTSLICCYKGTHTEIIDKILKLDTFNKPDSLETVQSDISDFIINNYKTSDFDLHKLHICITEFSNFKLKKNIYSNFTSLTDALDCCISSSHLPYITSDTFFKKYNNKFVLDGGLSPFPPKNEYIDNIYTISPFTNNYSNLEIAFYYLISKNITNQVIKDMYNSGINCCYHLHDDLKYIFI